MDMGMLQREVAVKIGVTESSAYNGELGKEPELVRVPKIIEFLGYVPFECPEDIRGRLRYYKLINGLSYIRLGKVMGRDPEQLTDWLTERKHPCKKNLNFIMAFLSRGR